MGRTRTVPKTKTVRKQRRTSSSASKVSAMAIARVSSCRSRTTETIILSNSTRMPKGRQKKAGTASRRHRAKKKEQRRGGTKEDKSLRGTTKLVRVIPVIKTKHQSKRTQDNVRSPRVARPPQEETSIDDRKKRKKNRKSNKRITQPRQQREQRQHQNNEAPTARCGILFNNRSKQGYATVIS